MFTQSVSERGKKSDVDFGSVFQLSLITVGTRTTVCSTYLHPAMFYVEAMGVTQSTPLPPPIDFSQGRKKPKWERKCSKKDFHFIFIYPRDHSSLS